MKMMNNNIEAQKVGFINAKLLKEKGFDVICKHGYDQVTNESIEMLSRNSEKIIISAPNQQVVIDWILANFNLLITIIPSVESQYDLLLRKYTIFIWRFSNGLNVQPIIIRLDGKDVSYFNKQEEAKEVAINHILTKLI